MRTYEQVWLENPEKPVYAIAASQEWVALVRAWIDEFTPGVVIEQLSDASFTQSHSVNDKNPHDFLTSHLPRPIIRLGFDEAQAERFERAWARLPNAHSDFYFLTNERSAEYREKGELDFTVTVPQGDRVAEADA